MPPELTKQAETTQHTQSPRRSPLRQNYLTSHSLGQNIFGAYRCLSMLVEHWWTLSKQNGVTGFIDSTLFLSALHSLSIMCIVRISESMPYIEARSLCCTEWSPDDVSSDSSLTRVKLGLPKVSCQVMQVLHFPTAKNLIQLQHLLLHATVCWFSTSATKRETTSDPL